jgi:hypothetical protein
MCEIRATRTGEQCLKAGFREFLGTEAQPDLKVASTKSPKRK